MPTNDFLAFAADPAANVIDQPTYAAGSFTQRITGFQTGTAFSNQCNKVWRQATMMSAMLGQFIVNEAATDAIDDGSPAGQTALLANFTTAVRQAATAGFGGYLPLSGGNLTGPLGISAAGTQLALNAPAGSGAAMALSRNAGMVARFFANTASALRWTFDLADATPETGANAGSNLIISRFADGGTFLDSPLTINRATGVVNFSHAPTINGGNLPYLPITGGTLSGPLGVAAPGITYAGTTGHYIAWGWNGSNINAYVDGSYQGDVALTSWVASTVGRYLPLAGGTLSGPLVINSNATIAGSLQMGSTLFLGGAGDFYIASIPGWRMINWAANWWDGWRTSDGLRSWFTYGGATMTMDGSANLTVSGGFYGNNGRIHTQAGWDPCVAVTDTSSGTSQGMWVSGDGLWWGWVDGGANPTNGLQRLGNDGVLTNWNGISCNSWINANGSISTNGNFWGAGYLSVNGRIYSYDRLNVGSYNPVYNMNNYGGGCGGLSTNAGGFIMGATDGSGNFYNTLLSLQWSGWLFTSGGVGTPSDASLKDNIQAAGDFDSLAAVQALESVSFNWKSTGEHQPFGLLAREVKEFLPDVVRQDSEGIDHLDLTALLVHALRAIKQLAEKVDVRH